MVSKIFVAACCELLLLYVLECEICIVNVFLDNCHLCQRTDYGANKIKFD